MCRLSFFGKNSAIIVPCERTQPFFSRRPVAFWLQNLKGEIGDSATDAMAAGRHEK
jgi:hypothetical protein